MAAAPAGGSIADRERAQRELCETAGGEFSQRRTAFGSVITTCKGGREDGYTCVNTRISTNCHKPLVLPGNDSPTIPGGGGAYDPIAFVPDPEEEQPRPGKRKKRRGGKKAKHHSARKSASAQVIADPDQDGRIDVIITDTDMDGRID